MRHAAGTRCRIRRPSGSRAEPGGRTRCRSSPRMSAWPPRRLACSASSPPWASRPARDRASSCDRRRPRSPRRMRLRLRGEPSHPTRPTRSTSQATSTSASPRRRAASVPHGSCCTTCAPRDACRGDASRGARPSVSAASISTPPESTTRPSGSSRCCTQPPTWASTPSNGTSPRTRGSGWNPSRSPRWCRPGTSRARTRRIRAPLRAMAERAWNGGSALTLAEFERTEAAIGLPIGVSPPG